MKIFSSEQVKSWDKASILAENISSEELMERAVTSSLPFILPLINPKSKLYIFCGKGNNGGDGLVLSRMLKNLGFKVYTLIVESGKPGSVDFELNLKKLNAFSISTITSKEDFKKFQFQNSDIFIDAILGNGLNKELEGFYKEVIEWLNAYQIGTKISIDVPTGLFGDQTEVLPNQTIFKASHTISFQQAKLSFLFAECKFFVGEFYVVDIGLNQDYYLHTASNFNFITKELVSSLFEKKEAAGTKHAFGHLLLIGGNTGKAGAIIMAAQASLASGCGRVTVSTTGKTAEYLQINSPQAMVYKPSSSNYEIELPKLFPYSALAIGPGLGKKKEQEELCRKLFYEYAGPSIWDADALSILAENKTWLSFLKPNSILTPHHFELEKLCGKTGNRQQMLQAAIELSTKNRLIIIYKGMHSAVCLPNGQVYFNSSGNAGLSKGGSGDILTGYIGGLLAKGYSAFAASIIGVYLHGRAADIASTTSSLDAMNYRNVLNGLNAAIKELEE